MLQRQAITDIHSAAGQSDGEKFQMHVPINKPLCSIHAFSRICRAGAACVRLDLEHAWHAAALFLVCCRSAVCFCQDFPDFHFPDLWHAGTPSLSSWQGRCLLKKQLACIRKPTALASAALLRKPCSQTRLIPDGLCAFVLAEGSMGLFATAQQA